MRKALRTVIPSPSRFALLLKLGKLMRPVLPRALKRKIPSPARAIPWPTSSHARKMLVLEGCVQPSLSPNTNAATARMLDRLGIQLTRAPRAGCCGAVPYHLNAQTKGSITRRNIDAWWPHVEQGIEAIVITASGCATMVAELRASAFTRSGACRESSAVSALMKDVSEVIAAEKQKVLSLLKSKPETQNSKFAFHPPCSLQHGLRMKGKVEALLRGLGFDLTPVPDSHLCCGSAGTYSILQPELSQQLLDNKFSALTSGAPTAIVTANIGCQSHLQTANGPR
jgi:glycolate oxidase iron-sulfur subunit